VATVRLSSFRWMEFFGIHQKDDAAATDIAGADWDILLNRPATALAENPFQTDNMPMRKRIIYMTLMLSGLATHGSLVARDFDVMKHGAVGNGRELDTVSIQKSIDAASAAKGGRVVFPAGTYLSGSIHLKSGVELHLQKGATLLGSTNHSHYQRLNFLALVMADGQKNIRISGEGVIDGQGRILAEAVMAPIKPGQYPDAGEAKRPVLINFRNCSDISVRGITLRESACWVQLYRDCDRILIENVTVRTMAAITNDGLDLDGCSNAVVRGCDIDSEDDAICLKSSRKACENILIEKCRIRSSCNALKFGTASAKGFKNITVRNLEIHDTYFSGIALEVVDGGAMENINISKVRMVTTNNPIFIRLGHRNVKGPIGSINGVTISDVVAEIPNRKKSEMNKFPSYWRHQCTTLITASITGLPGHPVRGVTLRNIAITYGGIGDSPGGNHHLLNQLEKIPECAESYPESKMFGVLPAWGMYCRHAEGITFENVSFRVSGRDYRAAVIFDDVRNLKLDRLKILSAGKEPPMVLNNVHGATITSSKGPGGSVEWIEKRGKTVGISIR
jgi:Glycosyl hydrolases family 28